MIVSASSFLTHEYVMAELCKRSYEEYVAYVNKNAGYIHGRFTRYITNLVQEFIEEDTGHAYDILCLSVPPQHGKSESITKALPSYLMGKYPKSRTIVVSYNSDMAEMFLDSNRQKLVDYNELFGIEIVKKTQEEIRNSSGGTIYARGMLAGITGLPAKYVIIDDPIKGHEEADSPSTREKMYRVWLGEIKSRLAPGAKVIVIQTRWHQQDLTGMLIENEPKDIIRVVNLPITCEKQVDEIGRTYGEALNPEIGKDLEWWMSFKQGYQNKFGSRTVNALYYGRPSNDEGGVFNRSWFTDNMYKTAPKVAYTIIEVDATFKDTKKSDFVAIQVWGKVGKHNYLLDKVKRRMGFIDTVQAITELASKYPEYNEIGIEDKANGSAIVDVLRRTHRAVIPIEPYGSKEARAHAISPMVEAGEVHLHESHMSVVDEAVDFPNSDHDDEVDCMSQSLNRLRNVVAEFEVPKDEDELDYEDQISGILSFR